MLVAIVDCLVERELDALVASLRRDGYICVPASTDLPEIDEALRKHLNEPVLLFGKESLRLPMNDCPMLWLCCGPETHRDDVEAAYLNRAPNDAASLRRREQALAYGYRQVTFIDARCFLASFTADSMGMEGKAAEILLRHAKNKY